MGAGAGVIRSGAALRSAGQAAQGREADAPRLASLGSADGAAAERLGLGSRARAPRLRRPSAHHRPGRAIALPVLRSSLVPRLSPRLPALRAYDQVIPISGTLRAEHFVSYRHDQAL